MRTIIAGGRDIVDYEIVSNALAQFSEDVTEVVSGRCRGADMLGEQWAKIRGIPVKGFHADWNSHGRAAGPMRNRKMAEYAEALVAIWDGKSSGTKNMIDEAKKRGLVVFIYRV